MFIESLTCPTYCCISGPPGSKLWDGDQNTAFIEGYPWDTKQDCVVGAVRLWFCLNRNPSRFQMDRHSE